MPCSFHSRGRTCGWASCSADHGVQIKLAQMRTELGSHIENPLLQPLEFGAVIQGACMSHKSAMIENREPEREAVQERRSHLQQCDFCASAAGLVAAMYPAC